MIACKAFSPGLICLGYQFTLGINKTDNSAFARLADSLNPIEIQKTAVLSLHPCDFLEMSNKDDVWHSCHCLADGSYRSGCLSYLCDTVTMVFYTVDNEVTDHFYRYPKLTRELFFFKDNLLFQSRLYPQNYYEPMEQYRSLVQKTISACLGVPNLWTFHEKRPEINKVYSSADNSTNYPDYEYHGNLSVLKGTEIHSVMEIGSQPHCVCCGRLHDNRNRLICDCDATVVCRDCGETVLRKDATYEDGAFFCKACLHVCAVCGEKSHGTMYPAINKKGQLISVCRNCYSDSVNVCNSCRVHLICSMMGCSFLCPNTAVFVREEATAYLL